MSDPRSRPSVYLNYACSADGKISSVARDLTGFGSSRDKDRMDRLRADADAVLIGAGTLRAEDPDLRVVDAARRRARLERGQSEQPLRAVVSSSLDLPVSARFFSRRHVPQPLVLTVATPPDDGAARLKNRAELIRTGRSRVDLPRSLRKLRERGVRRLLVEGGGVLNAALLEADLVDEIYMTVSPLLLGGHAAPTPVDGEGLTALGPRFLRLTESYRGGDEVFFHYTVVRGASSDEAG